MSDRWEDFDTAEMEALRDGLLTEVELDPAEDPTFPVRVEVAGRLIAEIERALERP